MLPLSAITFRSQATEHLTDVEFEVMMLSIKTIHGLRRVTGALIRRGGEMAEYVEGEPEAVKRAHDRICKSQFHSGVTVLEQGPISERVFEGFHEAFHGLTGHARHSNETARWRDALPAAREAAASNPPLAALIALWDGWADR